MNDLEKLFEHAPEGAETLRYSIDLSAFRWFNKSGKVFIGDSDPVDPSYKYQTIATRPQPEPRKTVEVGVLGERYENH